MSEAIVQKASCLICGCEWWVASLVGSTDAECNACGCLFPIKPDLPPEEVERIEIVPRVGSSPLGRDL